MDGITDSISKLQDLVMDGEAWHAAVHGNRVPEELGREVCNIVAEVITKSIPKKNARRQSGCLRRFYK